MPSRAWMRLHLRGGTGLLIRLTELAIIIEVVQIFDGVLPAFGFSDVTLDLYPA